MKLPPWAERALSFFDRDDPSEPAFDPVHLGAAFLITLAAAGVLWWLLWTLLVYEGGLFSKVLPALRVAFTSKTLQDFGYRGSWDRGIFEGWPGNLGALALCLLVLFALRSLYLGLSRRSRS